MEATIIILLVVGAVLLIAETMLPGGVLGVTGLICVIAGVVMSFREWGTFVGAWVAAGALTGILIGFMLWMRYFPQSPMARPFISTTTVGNSDVTHDHLVGKTGTAETDLRPSGAARIEGQRVNVTSEGQMIDKGAEIKVVSVQGFRILVRPV